MSDKRTMKLREAVADTYAKAMYYASSAHEDVAALRKEKQQVMDVLWDSVELKRYADELTHGLADLRDNALDLSEGQTLAECVGDPQCVIYHARDQLIAARAEVKRLQGELKIARSEPAGYHDVSEYYEPDETEADA